MSIEIFQHNSIGDLVWRRLIKIAILNFKDFPNSTKFWGGYNSKSRGLVLDVDNFMVNEIYNAGQENSLQNSKILGEEER